MESEKMLDYLKAELFMIEQLKSSGGTLGNVKIDFILDGQHRLLSRIIRNIMFYEYSDFTKGYVEQLVKAMTESELYENNR